MMPLPPLLARTQPLTATTTPPLMPSPVLPNTVQFSILQALPTVMPFPELLRATHPVTRAAPPTEIPTPFVPVVAIAWLSLTMELSMHLIPIPTFDSATQLSTSAVPPVTMPLPPFDMTRSFSARTFE